MKFSPSTINLFFQCPRRWYYQSIQAPTIPVDDRYARLGSNIHAMIEMYFLRQVDNPKPSDIERLAWEIFDTNFDDSLAYMRNQAKRIWRNFIEFEKQRLKTWKTYKPTFVEQMFEIDEYIHGIIDFYGDNKIIDWKTGNYTYLTNDIVRQGNFYKYMLEKAGYKVEKILFVYLKENKVVEIPQKPHAWVENEVEKVKRMIEQGYFPKRKSSLCQYCEYRLVCEFDDTMWWLL